MVISIYRKKLLFIFVFGLTINGYCQNYISDENIRNNRSHSIMVGKFSLIIEPQVFSSAKLTDCIGYKKFENKSIWNGSLGFGYELQRNHRNELYVLAFAYFEPLYKISFEIKEEELPDGYYGLYPVTTSDYTMASFSLGIYNRYRLKYHKRVSYNIIGGVNVKYFPYGSSDFGVGLSNTTHTESLNVFNLYCESSSRSIHGSCQIGAGIGFAIWKGYLNIELLRNFNFNDSITGEYIWWNLADNGISSGNYKLKGDYTSLKLSIRKFSKLKK
jgi:hypothetical protein